MKSARIIVQTFPVGPASTAYVGVDGDDHDAVGGARDILVHPFNIERLARSNNNMACICVRDVRMYVGRRLR